MEVDQTSETLPVPIQLVEEKSNVLQDLRIRATRIVKSWRVDQVASPSSFSREAVKLNFCRTCLAQLLELID